MLLYFTYVWFAIAITLWNDYVNRYELPSGYLLLLQLGLDARVLFTYFSLSRSFSPAFRFKTVITFSLPFTTHWFAYYIKFNIIHTIWAHEYAINRKYVCAQRCGGDGGGVDAY